MRGFGTSSFSRAEVAKAANILSSLKGDGDLTESSKLEKTMSKFWETVGLNENGNHLHVQLDDKTLRTPLGQQLVLPKSRQTLASLIVSEWKNLPDLNIKSYLIPLTSISSRAIDLSYASAEKDSEAEAKIGRMADIKVDLLRYLDTDTLLVFSPKSEYEGKLREAQEEIYRPIITSMEEFFTAFSQGEPVKLKELDADVDGLRGNKQDSNAREAALRWMDTLDVWQLVALEHATLVSKSLLCGVAIVRSNSKNNSDVTALEDVARAATLETIYQTERWGEVEDTHDVGKADIRRNLAAAALAAYEY